MIFIEAEEKKMFQKRLIKDLGMRSQKAPFLSRMRKARPVSTVSGRTNLGWQLGWL